MAVIKLGAIVTQIAGSVGGTNFRRFRNTTVMSNKSFGASKNKLLQNNGLFQNVQVIQQWSGLSQATRNSWNAQALLFQFPDKFGALKNLSGRELYIKLISSIRNTTFSDPNVNTLSSVTDVITINSGSLIKSSMAKITLDQVYANSCILIQIQPINGEQQNAVFNRRKAIVKDNNAYTAEVLFTNTFWSIYSYAQVGDKFRVFATPINKSGFRGLTKTILLTVV